mmetsp:Transcript_7749/g.23646  ORF Transcript_7749/g.23646 Transcript_7749/m.23646 type:complete len:245 (+) Transcript_7749:797-1531(+)
MASRQRRSVAWWRAPAPIATARRRIQAMAPGAIAARGTCDPNEVPRVLGLVREGAVPRPLPPREGVIAPVTAPLVRVAFENVLELPEDVALVGQVLGLDEAHRPGFEALADQRREVAFVEVADESHRLPARRSRRVQGQRCLEQGVAQRLGVAFGAERHPELQRLSALEVLGHRRQALEAAKAATPVGKGKPGGSQLGRRRAAELASDLAKRRARRPQRARGAVGGAPGPGQEGHNQAGGLVGV